MRRVLEDSSTVLEVNLDAIAQNTAQLRRLVGSDCQVFAALKCDAYGLGLVPVAQTILEAGGDAISVARVGDAVELRESGVDAPLLLYPSHVIDPGLIRLVHDANLDLTVWDLTSLEAAGMLSDQPIEVFLKVDVGLRRLGVAPESIGDVIAALRRLPKVRLSGVLAHLHVPADPVPDGYLEWQFQRFRSSVSELEANGFAVPTRMAASSGVLRLTREMNLNAVDPGRLFFGLVEDGPAISDVTWKPPVSALTTKLISVKEIRPDQFSGYAQIPVRDGVRVGIIPVGTSDGALLWSAKHVLIHGRPASLFPSVSLEHSRIDLSNHPEAKAGDEVVVIGERSGCSITVEQVAQARGIPPVLVLASVAASIRRTYRREVDLA